MAVTAGSDFASSYAAHCCGLAPGRSSSLSSPWSCPRARWSPSGISSTQTQQASSWVPNSGLAFVVKGCFCCSWRPPGTTFCAASAAAPLWHYASGTGRRAIHRGAMSAAPPTQARPGWKPDGADMPVAEEDLAEYLRLRCDAKPRRWRDAID